MIAERLDQKFYSRKTETVARELLGCTLVHVVDGQRLAGVIVETEAYLGIEDRACHTFGDRKTNRTRSMYLEGGHAYVYFIYGMHFCFNVVTRSEAEPEAVLIRALLPTEGTETMRQLRQGAKKNPVRERDLANGPGKVCQALAITRECDGFSLLSEELFIEIASRKLKSSEIEISPRVGVDYAGEHASWPLRFLVREQSFVKKE